jgi:hypothetical protein
LRILEQLLASQELLPVPVSYCFLCALCVSAVNGFFDLEIAGKAIGAGGPAPFTG